MVPVVRDLVVVSHKYPPYASGGLAPYVQRSLDGLRRSRPEMPVTLFTLDYPDRMPSTLVEPNGLRVVRPALPGWLRRRFLNSENSFRSSGRLWFGITMAWFNLRVLVRVVRHLARVGRAGTVVGVHDWQSSPAGIACALLLRVPVAYHVHNTELTMTTAGRRQDPFGLIRRFERWMGRVAAVVVVPTPQVRELLVASGWNLDLVQVVPHGYETPELLARLHPDDPAARDDRHERVARLRRTLDLGEHERVLVFAGRLSPVKGIGTLLRALPEVVRAHPQVRLLVLGVGFPGTRESADVHHLVAETGMADHVHVYDAYLPAQAVFDHYALADVCVFPSTYEPFGLVSVEAMALGRPVVLGPGFSDLIAVEDEGPTAFRTDKDDPDELARVLTAVLADPESAARTAGRGCRHVRRHLTWTRSADRLLDAYDRVASPA